MSRIGVVLGGGVVGVVLLLTVLLAGITVSTGPPNGVRAGSVPTRYLAFVLTAGRTCDAAPASILAAQVEVESGWDPSARSPAGAQGIAQFMPGTWRRWGRDANGDGRADPWDPHDAIVTQAVYDCALATVMEEARRRGRVHGALVDLMLAAYNAGPAAVLLAGGVPRIQETQGYVGRVVARAAAYADGGASDADGFAARLLRVASAQTGVAYAWGGGTLGGPSEGIASGLGTVGFDCSGFVRFAVFQASGGTVVLPRTAEDQTRVGTPVPVGRLRPGDVISFTRAGETAAHHVGIYLGGHRMINAPRTGGRVRVESLDTDYWRGQRWRAVRYDVR